MTTSVYANGDRVRGRLLDQGLSDREFSRQTGLGQSVVRGILYRNEINGSTPIADIARCLNHTGLSASDLLDPPAPSDPDNTPEDDIQVLAQLLNSEKRMHTPERITIALGWTTDRLRTTLRELDAHLRPLGLRIHENAMGVTIRAADNRHEEASERLSRLRDDEDGIHQGLARVLYAAYAGTLSGQETKNDHMVALGALRNRRAIQIGTGKDSRYRLTPDTAYAFDVPAAAQPTKSTRAKTPTRSR